MRGYSKKVLLLSVATSNPLQERHQSQAYYSDMWYNDNFFKRQVSVSFNPVFGNIQDTSVLPPKYNVGHKILLVCTGRGSSFVTSLAASNSWITTQVQREKKTPGKSTKVSCLLYEEGHRLGLSPKRERKLHREKIDFLKEKGVCFGWWSVGHMSKDCGRRLACKMCNINIPPASTFKKGSSFSQDLWPYRDRSTRWCLANCTCTDQGFERQKNTKNVCVFRSRQHNYFLLWVTHERTEGEREEMSRSCWGQWIKKSLSTATSS